MIIGIAVLAAVAILAFFLLNANRNDAIRTDAVTSAASSVADCDRDGREERRRCGDHGRIRNRRSNP